MWESENRPCRSILYDVHRIHLFGSQDDYRSKLEDSALMSQAEPEHP